MKLHPHGFFRVILVILIIWLGFKAIQQTIEAESFGPFTWFQYGFFAVLAVVTIAVMVLETNYYRHNRRITQYIVSFSGVVFCSIAIANIMHRNSIDSAKTVLRVSTMPEAGTVLLLELKEEGYMKMTEYELLEKTIYYGRYELNNDTLKIAELSDKGLSLNPIPYTGVIRNDTVHWDKLETMLVDHKE
jgi:hypothetical protein